MWCCRAVEVVICGFTAARHSQCIFWIVTCRLYNLWVLIFWHILTGSQVSDVVTESIVHLYRSFFFFFSPARQALQGKGIIHYRFILICPHLFLQELCPITVASAATHSSLASHLQNLPTVVFTNVWSKWRQHSSVLLLFYLKLWAKLKCSFTYV